MTQLVAETAASKATDTAFRTATPHSRIDAVDGLRAFAVMGVIAFHFGVGPPGGFLGVDLFFVISGYVITRALIRERDAHGGTDLSAFWRRRFRRIFPTLAVILIVVAIWSWVGAVSPSFRNAVSEGTLAALVSAANWWQIVGPTGYWALGSDRDPLAHLWSLGVEEQFYLVFPILFLLLARFLSPSWRWQISALGTVLAYSWTAILAAIHIAPMEQFEIDRIYLGTDTRSGALLAGCALACFLARRADVRSTTSSVPSLRGSRRMGFSVLAAACLVALGVLWTLAVPDDAIFFTLELPLAGLAAVVLIGCVSTFPGSVVARAFSWPPLALIGRWSYALYLWHWVVWVFLLQTALQGTALLVPVALTATLLLSVGSYYIIERPILRRNWKWATIVPVVAIVSAALAVSALMMRAEAPLPETDTDHVVVTTH